MYWCVGVGTKGRRMNEHFVGEMQLGIEHKLSKDRVTCPQNDFYKQEGEGQSFRTAHKGILLKVVAWITELLPDFYSKNKNICPSNQYPLVNGTSHWGEKLYLCPGPKGQQTSSPKGQTVNILDTLGHTIFIVETQLSYYTAKVAISNTYVNMCVVV